MSLKMLFTLPVADSMQETRHFWDFHQKPSESAENVTDGKPVHYHYTGLWSCEIADGCS